MRCVHTRCKKCQSYPKRTQNVCDQFSVRGDQITLSRVGRYNKAHDKTVLPYGGHRRSYPKRGWNMIYSCFTHCTRCFTLSLFILDRRWFILDVPKRWHPKLLDTNRGLYPKLLGTKRDSIIDCKTRIHLYLQNFYYWLQNVSAWDLKLLVYEASCT